MTEKMLDDGDLGIGFQEMGREAVARGTEVIFGNKLLLSETVQSLIVDWDLFQDSVPADSQDNQRFLNREEIFNGMCPRGPSHLKKRMEEKEFVALKKRRSQTEARIGIFKNVFLGRPLRAKGFENRQRALAWAVLTHNLWVLARMEWKDEAEQAA